MLKLQSYILVQIAKAVIFATVTIVLVASSLYSQRYFTEVVEYGVPFTVFLWLILCTMPLLMVVVIPVTLCAGIIFVYAKMSADNEIVALRACGIGQFTLLLPALVVGIAATAASYSMTLYFIPVSTQTLRVLQSQIMDMGLEPLLRERTFNTFGPSLTLYFRSRSPDGAMQGVLIQDNRNASASVAIVADSATITRSGEVYAIRFRNGNLQQRERDSGGISAVYFDSYVLEINIAQIFPRAAAARPSVWEYHLRDLFDPPPELRNDPEQINEMLAEGNQRLASPLMCLTIVLVVGATMFIGQYRRHGDRLRFVLIGAFVAALLIAYQVTIIAAAHRPILLPLIHLMVWIPATLSLTALYLSNWTAHGGLLAVWLRRRRVPVGDEAGA